MPSNVILFEEQRDAFMECGDFLYNGPRSFRLKRLKARAGTGKSITMTTLVSFLMRSGFRPVVCAFTGRAASQISDDTVKGQTTHSILYTPKTDSDGNLIGWDHNSPEEARADYDALVLDEGSMLPFNIFNDLMRLNLPMLVIGDDCQLPPVEMEEKNKGFNLMSSGGAPHQTHEDSVLTVNRRVGEGTDGLVELAEHLVGNDSIPRKAGEGIKMVPKKSMFNVEWHRDNRFDVVLCGYNKNRRLLNSIIRKARGFTSDTPEPGDRVVNLRNNVIGGTMIYNGDLFDVDNVVRGNNEATYFLTSVDDPNLSITALVKDETWETEKPYNDFSDDRAFSTMAFGNCLSCHKLQGSTVKNLAIYPDWSIPDTRRAWRYTAVTRAANHLTIGI